MIIIPDYKHFLSQVTLQPWDTLIVYSQLLAIKNQLSLINNYSQVVNNTYLTSIGLFNII